MDAIERSSGGHTRRASKIRYLDAAVVRRELRKRSAYPMLRAAVDAFSAVLMIVVSLVLLDGNGFDHGLVVLALACGAAATFSVFVNQLLHMLVDIPDVRIQHELERWKQSDRQG
jgi:hypothetical protein